MVRIATGLGHNCGLFAFGKVKCFGVNDAGQLGYGDLLSRGKQLTSVGDNLPFVDISSTANVVSVYAGSKHTCAILTTSAVKCWGFNLYGQLGYGDINNRGDENNEMGDNLSIVDLGNNVNATSMALGLDFSCVLFTNGRVKCFGRSLVGQIGYESTTTRGSLPNQMGSLLPYVSFGSNKKVQKIFSSASATHVCVILDNQTTKCWGNNDHGQLGLGDATNRGITSNQMGDYLPPVNFGGTAKAVQLVCGEDHTCVLLDNDAVKCWGSNEHGQLGAITTGNIGDQPGEMGNVLLPITLFGVQKPVLLSVGEDFTCVLLAGRKTLKCWGSNDYGETDPYSYFGHGSSLPLLDFGSLDSNISFVSSGAHHNCVTFNNLRFLCWGKSENGESGPSTDIALDLILLILNKVFVDLGKDTKMPTTHPTPSPSFHPTSPTIRPTRVPTRSPYTRAPTDSYSSDIDCYMITDKSQCTKSIKSSCGFCRYIPEARVTGLEFTIRFDMDGSSKFDDYDQGFGKNPINDGLKFIFSQAVDEFLGISLTKSSQSIQATDSPAGTCSYQLKFINNPSVKASLKQYIIDKSSNYDYREDINHGLNAKMQTIGKNYFQGSLYIDTKSIKDIPESTGACGCEEKSSSGYIHRANIIFTSFFIIYVGSYLTTIPLYQ